MRINRAAVLLVLIGVLSSKSSQAQDPASYYESLTRELREIIQFALIWTGDYDSMVDGAIGPRTIGAIRNFETRYGLSLDGILMEFEVERLADEAMLAMNAAGFEVVSDPATGAVIGLPTALVSYLGPDGRLGVYSSRDETVAVITVEFNVRDVSLNGLMADMLADPQFHATYDASTNSWFVLTGLLGGSTIYQRCHQQDSLIRCFVFSYPPSQAGEMHRISVAMSNVFDPFPDGEGTSFAERVGPLAGEGSASIPPSGKAPAPPDSPGEATVQTGSAFVVSEAGHILTNAHVVEGCTLVTVGNLGTTSRVRRDEVNDLALLTMLPTEVTGLRPVAFAPEAARLGDEVIALGYPLAGLLADSLNVTTGILSSLAGVGGDTRFIQTTAEVQPGNSGGPLVNMSGELVGIVTAKLDALAVFEAVGDIPVGVNFAIRLTAIESFLDSVGVRAAVGAEDSPNMSIADVAELVGPSVLPISCISGG